MTLFYPAGTTLLFRVLSVGLTRLDAGTLFSNGGAFGEAPVPWCILGVCGIYYRSCARHD